jgi:anti-sigma factor RsiW
MTDVQIVDDADLNAYIDDQLDMAGRVRVEAWLACHPDVAASVMADLGVRSTLKLSMMLEDTTVGLRTQRTARELESTLSQTRLLTLMRKLAAVGVLVSAGWIANTSFGARVVNATAHPPAFVEQAIRAHHVTLVRAAMRSQPEVEAYDRDDIRAATAIVMPELPDDWKVVDVQVFPSEFGPSVEAAVRTPDGTQVSLFAGRPGTFAVTAVENINLTGAEAAWWQIGDVAYAVVSSTPNIGLTDEAELLKTSLY